MHRYTKVTVTVSDTRVFIPHRIREIHSISHVYDIGKSWPQETEPTWRIYVIKKEISCEGGKGGKSEVCTLQPAAIAL